MHPAPTTSTDVMKMVKHLFMTYRNGIVADTLRKAGLPFGVIFGLQLPQLSGIARDIPHDIHTARMLWADQNVRESRLLACWIFPADELSEQEAYSMACGVLSREEADILAFRLLRHLSFAPVLVSRLISHPDTLPRYAGQALLRNLNQGEN